MDTKSPSQAWSWSWSWPPVVDVDPEKLQGDDASSHAQLPPDPRPLLGLPQELLLEIWSHLDERSRICLLLTCKRLKNDLPRLELDGLNPQVQIPLLLLLEKDIPDVYFCHHCAKLHRWARCRWKKRVSRGMSFKTYDCRKYRNLATKETPSLTWDVLGAIRLPFQLPQLIMNRHFRGRRHGIKRSMLKFKVRMVSEHGPRCKRKWRAKIVDGELMLRSKMKVEYPGRGLRLFFDYTPHGICRHTRLDAIANHCLPFMESSSQREARKHLKQVEELSLGRHIWINGLPPTYAHYGDRGLDPGTGPRFEPAGGALRSCQRCMTDYVINISQREPPAGRSEEEGNWVITVRTWHDLGPVRSPADWKWASLVDDNFKIRRDARDPAKFGKGAVWRKWVAAKLARRG